LTVRLGGRIARTLIALLTGATLVAGCVETAPPAPSVAGSPGAASASPSLTVVPSSPGSPSPEAGYANPVMANDAPDPSVIRGDDGAFYAYTTQAYHDVEFTTVPILRSMDLVTWELVGDAFAGDARPSWIVPGSGNGDVWAPHIARIGGKYLLYYSASSASTLSFGIGVAVADSPTGPFTDVGQPLLTGPGFTTIDPFVLDDDGDLYLYWGSAHEPIWVQPLAPDGLSLAGERTSVLEPSRRPYESLIEGPWVVKQDGFYHLLYSGDACCGADPNYAVLDARATSPLGPFERDPGNPVLEANDRFNAPGHNAVVTDDAGRDWMVYHAMDREEGSGLRFLMLDPIDWSSGWPVVNGGTGPATSSSAAPVIKPGS
jgi:arabinan endo-1,5-alpha-L-arabinosidase